MTMLVTAPYITERKCKGSG